jgi:adenylyltransferase/sulfurtransferase
MPIIAVMVDRNPQSKSRYQRQQRFAPLGKQGDGRLRKSAVLIVGCGALGSHVAELLARAGVGRLVIVDRDVVEWSNLHRQVGFTESDARAGAPKASAFARHIAGVNSEVDVRPEVTDFNARAARQLADGVDLIVDGTDNLPTRYLINDLSLELDVPWVYGGAVGQEAHAQLFVPRLGPCLRCVLPDLPPAGTLATCDTAGVIGPAPAAAASYEAALALRYLAGGREDVGDLAGRWVRLRLWDVEASVSRVRPDPNCPACGRGERSFLEGECGESSTVLCGRGAVQVLPASHKTADAFDLDALADRLSGAGRVERQHLLLRFRPDRGFPADKSPGARPDVDREARMTVFRDGRAIIEGTSDPDLARSLYNRYVGQ